MLIESKITEWLHNVYRLGNSKKENNLRTKDSAIVGIVGVLSAWLLLDIYNIVGINLLITEPSGGIIIRLNGHMFDVGHHIILGILSAIGVSVWRRMSPSKAKLDLLALWLLCIGLGYLILDNDMIGMSRRFRLIFALRGGLVTDQSSEERAGTNALQMALEQRIPDS